jgi:hypothetical protein
VIRSLRIENFRGFADHRVVLPNLAVLVGANNAGKSTIVEALRLVGLTADRLRRGTMSFRAVPDWLDHPLAQRGLQPARRATPIDGHGPSTFHRYADPPSALTAEFETGCSVSVFVGPLGQLHAVARDPSGVAAGSAADAKRLDLPPLSVQPQISPVLRVEKPLTEETVKRGEGTYLVSQHFRNHLLHFSDALPDFRKLAEGTWPGLQIRGLEGGVMHPDEPLELEIRDSDFVGELRLMGHGLQMWLQTIWFLARADRGGTVVLDEPDVYMHPDLQRRLLGLVRNRFAQVVVATHSIEIISDVRPESVVPVDRRQPSSGPLPDMPSVQKLINELGGVHSLEVTRLLRARTYLLVEGHDVALLRILQLTLNPDAEPIDLFSNSLGGRGAWISGRPRAFPKKNIDGERVRGYCILDRDYFPDAEVSDRYAEAKSWGIRLHVWSRKEIENFLLVPEAVSRLISRRLESSEQGPTAKRVAKEIDRIVDSLRADPITEAVITLIHQRDKKSGAGKASTAGIQFVGRKWRTREGRWGLAPGKDVLAALSQWSKDDFGVSFSGEQVAHELTASEIHPEVAAVIRAVPVGAPFPNG